MKTQIISCLIVAAAFCSTAPGAFAQSLRCKTTLISVGDSRVSVSQKCGQPVAKDSFCKRAEPEGVQIQVPGSTVVNVVPCIKVDEWVYNPGYGQFMTTLRFEEGVLRAIRYGDRVQ